MMNKTVSVIALLLIAAQVLLVLLSWLLSAMMTEGVHSLLSGEGVRWFFGSFTHMVASPLLAWLLLLCMAGGCLVKSGLWRAFSHPRTPVPRTSNYLSSFLASSFLAPRRD
jgi:aminobenzoyl-glutamate transport protein